MFRASYFDKLSMRIYLICEATFAVLLHDGPLHSPSPVSLSLATLSLWEREYAPPFLPMASVTTRRRLVCG